MPNNTEELFQKLLKAVKEMRGFQKEFFSNERKPSSLGNARIKEREVDNIIKDIETPEAPSNQASLFQ